MSAVAPGIGNLRTRNVGVPPMCAVVPAASDPVDDHLATQRRRRRQRTMVPDGVLASWRHQRREARHEVVDVVSVFEAERRGPIPPWMPQREDDAVLTVDAQAGQRNGRTQDVPTHPL